MKERALLEVMHTMVVRCAGVTVKPSPKQERVERVYSASLLEVDEQKAGLVGAAMLRDIPHEMARRLSEELAAGRRYRLTFRLEEVPELQQKLGFDEAAANREALAEAGGGESSVSTVTITAGGRSVTTTPAGLARAAKRAARAGH